MMIMLSFSLIQYSAFIISGSTPSTVLTYAGSIPLESTTVSNVSSVTVVSVISADGSVTIAVSEAEVDAVVGRLVSIVCRAPMAQEHIEVIKTEDARITEKTLILL